MTETTTAIENAQRDAAVIAKPDLSLLSSELTMEDFPGYSNDTKPNVLEKKETITESVEAKTEPVVEEIKLEEIKSTEEVKLEEKEGEVKVDEKIEFEETPLSLESTSEPAEGSWKAIAKLEGIEIPEDSYESLKEALIAPLREQLEQAKSLTKETLLAELDPEHRMYMELAETGMSYENIVLPLIKIEQYKALNDVELYREDLLARYPNATSEWIDADVEKAVENGQTSHDAARIRMELDEQSNLIKSERQEIIEKYKVNKANFLDNQRTQETESVTKAMNDMSTFMGKTIPKELTKQMAVNYSKGEYNQILKDPQAIAEFIAYKKLGEQIRKNIVAENYAKGKLESAKQMHNIPPIETGGASRSTTTKQGDGNFDNLTAADFEIKK